MKADMLRLTANDGDDLAVISAQMQDAVIKLSDINFNVKRRQFAMVANRFAWDARPQKIRRRSGLHFDSVLGVKKSGLANVGDETVLSLLSIDFTPTDAPAGYIILAFSAGHQLRLEIECLDVTMSDLGPAWPTEFQPEHAD